MKQANNLWVPDDCTHFRGLTYQKGQRDKALRHVKNFRNAVDIGAHVGTWAMGLAEKFKYVYAFEPREVVAECLERNMTMLPNYQIYHCALGSREDKCDIKGNEKGNSGMFGVKPGDKYEMHKLDHFSLRDVDFIKIDTEGYEYDVLMGAEDTIRNWQPIINVEIKNENLKTYSVNDGHVMGILKGYGYELIERNVNEWVFGPK